MAGRESPHSGWLRTPARYFSAFFACGVILLAIDPFGLTRLTKRYSEDLFAIALSDCYPVGRGRCQEAERLLAANTDAAAVREPRDRDTRLAVVLLTDSDLDFARDTWPPSYGLHARVLKAIRINRPRALFIDIVFADRRDDESIALLERELAKFGEESIPVYAATFSPDAPLRNEVRRHVIPVAVPKRSDALDRVTRIYDLGDSDSAAGRTAAAALFSDVCRGNLDGAPETIRLFWASSTQHGVNDRWLDCRHRPAFPWWIFQNRETDFREDCPATPTIPVRVLLEPSESDDIEIERLIDDQIVLYGAYFRGAADTVNTPLHNDLPGVFLHATALDNLMTLGPSTVAHGEYPLGSLPLAWPDVAMLFAAALFSTARRFGRSPTAEKGSEQRKERRGPSALIGYLKRGLRIGQHLLGNQAIALFAMVLIAMILACRLGFGFHIADWGINVLFAVAWTELVEISGKLKEVSEDVEDPSE